MQEKQEALSEIRTMKIDGIMLRSRCRYEALGEKPTTYFLNLEKRKYKDKVIQPLIDENGEQVYKTKDILEEHSKNTIKIYIEK